MKTLDHRFRSSKSDGPDTTQIQPSNWNDGHVFSGGGDGQVLVRDTSDAAYGARWASHGIWTDIPFNAGAFHGASGMTWTVTSGNASLRAYTLFGKTCLVAWAILDTTIGGTPSPFLSFDLPAPLAPNPAGEAVLVRMFAGGTWRAGTAYTSFNTPAVNIAMIDLATIPAGLFSVQGQILFRVAAGAVELQGE